MNKKGFTLVELIVVIVMLLIISGLVISNVMNYISTSKEKAFDLLEESIKNSAETIFLDKEASSTEVFDSMSISIPELKDKGYIELEELKNPKNDADISKCKITITKVHEGNLWKYQIETTDDEDEDEYEYEYCPCYNGSCN